MRFSERLGFSKARAAIQTADIDEPLRNSLWNVVQIFVFAKLDEHQFVSHLAEFRVVRSLWLHFFKSPLDQLQGYWPAEKPIIREWFFKATWLEVYDFVEFVAQELNGEPKRRYLEVANSYLERELSAFRFVDDLLTRVTSDVEVDAIDAALGDTSDLPGVRAHLLAAVEKLGDRGAPDYRNTIKESISAVEGMCQLLTREPGATLGSALKKLRAAGIEIHPALEKAWLALYGYTNDKGGIRHAMLDEATLTQADARYMLVSCSAFVSYLVALAADAKIALVSA